MKFSMIFEAQIADPTPETERQVIRDCVEQAVLAEEMGFHRIWAVEHHCLHQYAHMSAPESFLAFVAARTSTIRIGHGVICLPFAYNHPLRVAERVAMLDVLSDGRVDLGVGRGSTDQEMGAFGVDKDRSMAEFEESLRMLPRMWQDELFEHHGELLSVPPRPVLPRPVQEPHPPLYMACTREEMFTFAGTHGIGAMALGFAGPADIAAKNERYRAACAARDESDVIGAYANDWLTALCPAVVLDDREHARRVGFRGQRFFVEAIAQFKGGPPPTRGTEDVDNETYLRERGNTIKAQFGSERIGAPMSIDQVRSSGLQRYHVGQAYGTPEDAIAYVEALEVAGADEAMFLLQMGTIPQELILESIRMIGEHVIPRFVPAGV